MQYRDNIRFHLDTFTKTILFIQTNAFLCNSMIKEYKLEKVLLNTFFCFVI